MQSAKLAEVAPTDEIIIVVWALYGRTATIKNVEFAANRDSLKNHLRSRLLTNLPAYAKIFV